MPQFLRLLPPDDARDLLLSQIPDPEDSGQKLPWQKSELIETLMALGRVTAEVITAPHSLPEFRRSAVDGYAVRSVDTFGANDSMPTYLNLVGEILMGKTTLTDIKSGECILIHTGGMLPEGADAVIMLEYTQELGSERVGHQEDDGKSDPQIQKNTNLKNEIEITHSVAVGENIIFMGEDVSEGNVILPKGRRIRPPEIGGLIALGILNLRVVNKPRVGIISSGDEIVNPNLSIQLGQVRDINSYSLSGLVTNSGGEPVLYGIVPDQISQLIEISSRALTECDMVVITAGSSASARDMTAKVIDSLGDPGVIVHGINTRPGKPTILGVCSAKAIIGLPGNPVSALVNGYLFVVPVIEKLLGLEVNPSTWSTIRPSVMAKLSINLSSQAGREDWWPVKLIKITSSPNEYSSLSRESSQNVNWLAEPIFGKSNLIFTLIKANGLIRIPPEITGLNAGEIVEVVLY
jgi:molybdopterin molybdotransferase